MKSIANFESFQQLDALIQLLPKLEQNPDIDAVWLSGSFASGTVDLHNDVDLRIAVPSETSGCGANSVFRACKRNLKTWT